MALRKKSAAAKSAARKSASKAVPRGPQATESFAVLDHLPAPLLAVDGAGRVVFASAAATRLLGQAASQIIAQPLAHFLTSSVTPHALAAHGLLRVGTRNVPVDVAESELSIDGRPLRLLLLQVRREPPTPGPAPTSESALAEVLAQNEERLRHATQAAHVGIFDLLLLPLPPPAPYWSETLRAMLGYDADAPADYVWFRERVHPDDAQLLDGAIARSVEADYDGTIDMEYRWKHPVKGYRWLMTRSVSHYIEVEGQLVPYRSIGAMIDVTERRAAKEQELLRAAILDATPDLVAISRLDGELIYLNRAARAFLGLSELESLAGQSLQRAFPSAVIALLEAVAIPAAIARGSWSAETDFIRHDGELVPMSHVVLAQHDGSGQTAYLCTIARDLSKERALEERFRQAQKMEAIGRLAGGVAHDFNNLLSVILGYAELGGQELEEEKLALDARTERSTQRILKAQDSLAEIVRAGERAAGLTSQLLAFGRRQILKPRILDINEVLSEFTPMVGRLIGERIELNVIPARQPANIRADPNQVQQVLLNLVVNARDAMPEGGVLTIEAFRATVEESKAATRLDLHAGVYTVIAVSDTGHGMDADTKNRIFEPFFTTKPAGQGTGLGLSMVFGIVQQSGGSIWVYSEPGRGTTFKIYFPCTDQPVTAPPPPPPLVQVPQHGVILLCEDDQQVRSMVSDILMRAGYEVLVAAHPREALEQASRFLGRIDLLLTDVVMPGMTGTELARQLHATRAELPVLFTSGYTENTIVHQGVLHDGVNFLAKPLTPGRLLAAILEVLRQRPELP